MTSSWGSKLRSKVAEISKFWFGLNLSYFDQKPSKMIKNTFFCSFPCKISHFTEKIRYYMQKPWHRNFDPSRAIFFTFLAITLVLVGISEICLHIWKLEKKLKTGGVNRFFLPSRQSGQNRALIKILNYQILKISKVENRTPIHPLVVKNFKK